MVSGERVQEQVRTWRDELIDLTCRNRLLNLSRTRTSTLAITAPRRTDILTGLGSRSGWRFHYPPLTDEELQDAALVAAIETEDTEFTDVREHDELLTDASTSRQLSSVLRNLERRSAQEYLDKGLRVLYLAIGMLEWDDSAGDSWKSPLVLTPVALVRPTPRAPFRVVGTDDDVTINPALTVKLENDFEISLPSDVNGDLDIDEILAAIENAVADQKTWRVHREVVLSFFSFHKEVMYRDLKDNEEIICSHDLIEALTLGPDAGGGLAFDTVSEAQLDDDAPPEGLASILDADSTQRRCIVAARDGRSFVMDGPPGSGKSQTIANMIAELIVAGKTTLFVSEKAAALEVVKCRLDGAGLGSYVLELHSHKATRKEVAKALDAAVRERPVPRARTSRHRK